MVKVKDLTGQRFGRLIAVELAEKDKDGSAKLHRCLQVAPTTAIFPMAGVLSSFASTFLMDSINKGLDIPPTLMHNGFIR